MHACILTNIQKKTSIWLQKYESPQPQHHYFQRQSHKCCRGEWSRKNNLEPSISPLEPCVWGHAIGTEWAPGVEVAELKPSSLLAWYSLERCAFNHTQRKSEREKWHGIIIIKPKWPWHELRQSWKSHLDIFYGCEVGSSEVRWVVEKRYIKWGIEITRRQTHIRKEKS